MDLATLKGQFITDVELAAETLARVIERLLDYCTVGKDGRVDVKNTQLPAKVQVRLILACRLAASKLDDGILAEVTIDELAEFAALPRDQATARAKDAVDTGFAERTGRGAYRARSRKVEQFLIELETAK